MIQTILHVIKGSLASINLAALSSTLYKLAQRKSKVANRKVNQKSKRRSPAERFENINPYLQALTYSYSAYRLINNPGDPVAYVGTGIALSQLYHDCRTWKNPLRSK